MRTKEQLEERETAQKEVQRKIQRFVTKIYLYAGSVMGVLGLALTVLDIALKQPLSYLAVTVVFTLCMAASVVAAKRQALLFSGLSFLVGTSVVITVSVYLSPQLKGDLIAGLALVIVLAGFTIGPRASAIFSGSVLAAFYGAMYFASVNGTLERAQQEPANFTMEICLLTGMIAVFGVTVYIISNHAVELRNGLADRLNSIESFVPKIAESGIVLSAAAQEINVLANQQKQGASQQSVAIVEIRQSLQSLLEASVRISDVANKVRKNAEDTLSNSVVVANHINDLLKQTSRIDEIVNVIRAVADKSDLLSLNAALEATKAGEIGRGFSLVAEQMRRLTENIIYSLRTIKTITEDIVKETNATRMSTETAVRIAQATTEAGNEIELITRQQQSSTEQITTTMQDITVVSQQVAAGSEQTLESTQRLHEFASELPRLLDELKTFSV